MDDTNPTEQVVTQEQETLDKSNVQKRIDEITAARYAAEKRAEEAASQVAQLTSTVAEMMKAQHEAQARQTAPVAEQIPEGLDPAIAKFMKDQIERVATESRKQADQMYWQMQHQIDQAQVAQKYAHLPPEVLKEAAGRLTGLKQRYGEAANMDDAVGFAELAWYRKQAQLGRAAQYNGMSQPLSMQSGLPQPQSQSNGLVSPASLPEWDNWDEVQRNKAITEWEKKGGRLTI